MPAPTYTTNLSLAELEASYPLYGRSLRILIRDGLSELEARRTVCWQRLEQLHQALPHRYRHPRQLFLLLSHEISAA